MEGSNLLGNAVACRHNDLMTSWPPMKIPHFVTSDWKRADHVLTLMPQFGPLSLCVDWYLRAEPDLTSTGEKKKKVCRSVLSGASSTSHLKGGCFVTCEHTKCFMPKTWSVSEAVMFGEGGSPSLCGHVPIPPDFT
jgi:hypothetical protein